MKLALRIMFPMLLVTSMWGAIGTVTTSGTDCSVSTNCLSVVLGQQPSSSFSVGAASITLAGTWSGTAQFEASGDAGKTYQAISVTPLSSTTTVTSSAANGTWQVNLAGLTNIRVRASALASGSITVTITPSTASARSNGVGGGVSIDITASLPIVVTPNPITGTGTISCPTCAIGGTIADTTNVLKGDGSGDAIASSIVDNGTTETQTPNGLTTVNSGLFFTEQPVNASSGTVLNETICFNGSFQTTVCSTSAVFGVLGIAGVGAGNSGNVDNCITQCQVYFDGASTVGDWAIPSTTTAGYLHDTGSTVLPTNAQAFLVDSVASGSGQLATVDVFTPYVLFANQGRSQIIKINGGLAAVVANFNGTAPSAPSGENCTWQISTTGGVSSISCYITFPAANFVSKFPAIVTAQTDFNIAPVAVTFPANFGSSGTTPASYAKCGTNPTGGTVTWTLTDTTTSTTLGTVTITTLGVVTFATTGGTTQSMSINDYYTVVSGTDAGAANCVIDFRAGRN